MRTIEPFQEVPVTTGSAYSSGGQIAASFDQVQPPGRGRHPSIRGIAIELSLVFEHDAGAPVTLPEELAFRAIESIVLQNEGHTYVELDEQAGWLAYVAYWNVTGRKGQRHGGGGNISLTNGVTTTVTMGIYLPFMLFAGIEPDDINVSLSDLLGAQLVMRWAQAGTGGIFDSGANNERITTASTVKVFVDMIGRDGEHYRGGPKPTLRAWECPGVNERLPIVNERILFLTEVPLHASGITANRITSAERTTFKIEVDGDVPTDAVTVSYLSRQYNRVHPQTADDMLPNHEADTSPWLPLVYPKTKPFKITHTIDVLKTNPRVRFGGTDTSPKLLWLTLAKYDDAAMLRAVENAGVRGVPADELREHISKKTASKVEAGPDVSDSLPFSVKKRRR